MDVVIFWQGGQDEAEKHALVSGDITHADNSLENQSEVE